MSLCFDFDAGHWVTGPEGTKMRLAQLRAALPMLKVGHEKFCIDLKQKVRDGKVAIGVGSPQSPYSDAVYAHEKMIREYEALLREEEGGTGNVVQPAPRPVVPVGHSVGIAKVDDPSQNESEYRVYLIGPDKKPAAVLASFVGPQAKESALTELAKYDNHG